jgi:streptomycin 6-kinase
VIPASLARATIDREGAAGRAWIDALPGLVDQYLERWNCMRDGDALHGQVGVVVPVRRAQSSAVLKISFPHPGNVAEPMALAAWDGRGAVRLLERDDEQFAMLLERARQETLEDLDSTDEALVVFSDAAEVDRDLALGAAQARMVSSALWERQHEQPRVGVELAERIASLLVS